MPAFVPTPRTESLPPDLTPADAGAVLADLGFLSRTDLPDRPGPAYLLVALRAHPTFRHYDPERVEYWVTDAGRGRPRALTYDSPMPLASDVSWGLVRIVDRLHVTNEYLTFGGELRAEDVAGTRIVVIRSAAPILRRGGHSQGWDHGAECLGAFFGRLLLAVDLIPDFEARLATAGALARYAAFLGDLADRYRHQPDLRATHGELWQLVHAEEQRVRSAAPRDWAAGEALRRLGHID